MFRGFSATNADKHYLLLTGVPGILQTYQTCVSQIQLYGPTNFSPIINHVARFGAAAQREVGAKVRHSGKNRKEREGGGGCTSKVMIKVVSVNFSLQY